MKKIFIQKNISRSWRYKDWKGVVRRVKVYDYILEAWLITKEHDHSRLSDFKQLLKLKALARLLPG